jgi:putative membrane protein
MLKNTHTFTRRPYLVMMRLRILIHWIVTSAIFIGAPYVFSGITVANVWVAITAAFVLGVVNTIIRPIFKFLAFPITFLTFGLFTFAVNAFMVLLTSSIVPGFAVANFGWALLLSAIISTVGWLFHRYYHVHSL